MHHGHTATWACWHHWGSGKRILSPNLPSAWGRIPLPSCFSLHTPRDRQLTTPLKQPVPLQGGSDSKFFALGSGRGCHTLSILPPKGKRRSRSLGGQGRPGSDLGPAHHSQGPALTFFPGRPEAALRQAPPSPPPSPTSVRAGSARGPDSPALGTKGQRRP